MFEQCLYFNTTSLARKLEREWTAAFKPFGLMPPQAFLLRMVLAMPGNHQGDLAREMNVATATMSRTLDGLARLGFVERRASSQDTRGFQIYPTRQAVAIAQQLDAASGAVTMKFKRLLGSGEFSDVVSRLRDISTELG